MSRYGWVLLLLISIGPAGAAPPELVSQNVSAPLQTVSAVPTVAPIEQYRQVLEALRKDDLGGLISANGGETALKEFLTDGADLDPAELRAELAQRAADPAEREWLDLWIALKRPDGVAQASALAYPKWAPYVPQALAGAQMMLGYMAQSAAEDAQMTALEKSQMLEMQWALTGWLARTDFADRKKFESALEIAAGWIRASGLDHPELAATLGPEQRLRLGSRGIAAVKDLLELYGIDARAILASVKLETLSRDADQATIRISLNVLGVPMSFDQSLTWWEGEWQAAELVRMLRVAQESDASPASEDAGEPDADAAGESSRPQ